MSVSNGLFYSEISELRFTNMYCPSCGAECTTGLNYCNRCGANLSFLTAAPQQLVPISLTKPALVIGVLMTVLTLGGFGLLIGGARSLASVVTGNDPLMAMIFFGMVIILTIDIFLVRQLTKLINAALSTPNKIQRQVGAPLNIGTPHSAPPHIGSLPSVTENTTRFLDVEQTASVAHPPDKSPR